MLVWVCWCVSVSVQVRVCGTTQLLIRVHTKPHVLRKRDVEEEGIVSVLMNEARNCSVVPGENTAIAGHNCTTLTSSVHPNHTLTTGHIGQHKGFRNARPNVWPTFVQVW